MPPTNQFEGSNNSNIIQGNNIVVVHNNGSKAGVIGNMYAPMLVINLTCNIDAAHTLPISLTLEGAVVEEIFKRLLGAPNNRLIEGGGGVTEIIQGQKFGRWTVLEYGYKRNRNHYYKCVCTCGKIGYVGKTNLVRGKSTACVNCGKIKALNGKEGRDGTRLYRIYRNMKTRTSNPNSPRYNDYGGRGITICDEWLNDFDVFKSWAISNGYDNGKNIDRINNDMGYFPENCRWITAKENNNNRRTTRKITFNGETRSIKEWAEIINIAESTIRSRLNAGKSIAEALGQNNDRST